MREIDNVLEPLKVKSALNSELMKLEYRNQNSPKDISVLDYTIISALQKQLPVKPVTYPDSNRADCPICGNTVRGMGKPFGNYCSRCGQALNWENEEE